jgi:hypothetical protein
MIVLAMHRPAYAEGHGPAFTLATPTLGEGQWSSDTAAMNFDTDEGSRIMMREMLGYGVTEDLQVNVSFPLLRLGDTLGHPPRTRGGPMMGTAGDIEGTLLWRFHRIAPDIGSRRESTMLFGVSAPTEGRRGGVKVGPSVSAAVVTGYASRSFYWWLGSGYQYYFKDAQDQLGDLAYVSAVFGWRPPIFRGDYPKPDWRLFIEGIAERAGKSRLNGLTVPDSGGEKILIGPSVLGLYGGWGIQAGILLPVIQNLNGQQQQENFRAKMVFTYWF